MNKAKNHAAGQCITKAKVMEMEAEMEDLQIDPRRMASAAQKASELMKTLGHKDRLMVLCHLTVGEKSVGELARLLDIPQSPLSQHLARMRKESLVTTRREAQTIYYSIASGEAARIVGLMHELYCSGDG
jgi:DNA-binding transcriptional ArsR family regulator